MQNLAALNRLGLTKSGSGFSPTSISGLTAWYDASSGTYTDDGTTLATDGQAIKQWNDLSGRGNNAFQATTDARPLLNTDEINGKPAVLFDGTDDTMLTAAANILQQTVFAVAKIQTGAALLMLFSSNNDNSIRLNDTDGSSYRAFGSYNGGDWANENSGTFMVNGVNTATYPAAYHIVEAERSTVASGGIRLSGQTSNRFWNGWIAEFIMYSGVLSNADKSRVRAYLRSKYNLY